MSRSSTPNYPFVVSGDTDTRVEVEHDWFYNDRPEREWFTVRHDGLAYDVYAYSPAKAQEYFLMWKDTPVEVNWIKRNTALDKPQL